LITGLSRLEYRGYDSAGLAINADKDNEFLMYKQVGKVKELKKKMDEDKALNLSKTFLTHTSMAHTRWATHGIFELIRSTFSCEQPSSPIRQE
jgi:glucosamine--fructose-6-phosphate aminotransferase (isomerizing)